MLLAGTSRPEVDPVSGLTRRQAQALEFFARFSLERGRFPTYREACEALRINSPNGLQYHVDLLVRKGYLVKEYTGQGGLALRVKGLATAIADDDEGRRLSRALGAVKEN